MNLTFTHRPARFAVLVAALLAAGVVASAGLSSPAGTTPAAPVQRILVDGYPLRNDLPTIAAATMNESIVVATVQSVGATRWNTPDHGRPADLGRENAPIYHVSAPVQVRIDRVLAGPMQPGQTTVVRALGGERDGMAFDFEHFAGPGSFRPGGQVVLFLDRAVDAGDGLVAATPNHAFTVENGTAHITGGDYSVPLRELVATVRAARA